MNLKIMDAMKLKRVMLELGITQSQMAKAIQRPDGTSISIPTLAQLMNHEMWPKTIERSRIQAQAKALLFERGANDDHIVGLFEMETGAATILADCAAPVLPNAFSKESDYMLLRKNTVTREARQHFRLPTDPFTDEMQCDEDVFLSDDIRYVRQAIRQTAKHGGMLAVSGESGAGKSTLRQDLVEWININREPITIIEPYVLGSEDDNQKGKTLKSIDITSAVIRSIDPGAKPRRTLEERARQMHDLLRSSSQAGRRHVLIIEEAHGLTINTIKHLKRFYEIQEGFKKLMSIILIGQTELEWKLSEHNPAVREVVQRCEMVKLQPLDNHIEAYIKHKFERIGVDYTTIFEPSAFEEARNRLRTSVQEGRGSQRATKTLSLCYPLAVNNLIAGAMNEAVKVCEPKVTGELIAAAVRSGV